MLIEHTWSDISCECTYASMNCVIICSDKGWSPNRWQAITLINDDRVSIEPAWANVSVDPLRSWSMYKLTNILSQIYFKMSFVKWRTRTHAPHKHTEEWPGMRGFDDFLVVTVHRYDFQTRRRSWWVRWVHKKSHTATRHQRWRHQREWCIVGTTKSILSS